MNKLGRALIFIIQAIFFLFVLALIIAAAVLLSICYVYALTLIGIPKVVAQLTWMMLCLFVVIGR